MELIVDFHVMYRVLQHVRSLYPREACGVLLGYREGSTYYVTEARPLPRSSGHGTFFLLDVQEWLGCLLEARRRGLTYVGLYHSHPDSDPIPSPEDVHTMLQYPGEVWLIISVRSDGGIDYAAYVTPTPSSGITRVPVRIRSCP